MKYCIFFLLTLLFKPGLSQEAGELAPDAKTIDADKFYPFRNGSAMVQKGNALALINAKGEVVVPFNTYARMYFRDAAEESTSSNELPSMTGIYVVYNTKLKDGAFINAAGKIIYTIPAGHGMINERTGIGDNGYAYLRQFFAKPTDRYRTFKEVHLNAKGTVITFPDLSRATWNENIASFQDFDKTKKYGFKNSKGETIISPQFDAASVFREGLAAVAKKNEFGELKWGFIDTKGKGVIPFKFSIKPGDFGNGLAPVVPTEVEDFKFAFINRQGEIVLKIPVDSPMSPPGTSFLGPNTFQHGYYFSNFSSLRGMSGYVLDTTGKVFPAGELFKLFNLPTTYSLQTKPFYNQQMFFAKKCVGNDCKKGILDFSTRTYVAPVFDELSFFDPVSNLAYAKRLLSYNHANDKSIYREGYINRQGVFVIVKAAPDKF